MLFSNSYLPFSLPLFFILSLALVALVAALEIVRPRPLIRFPCSLVLADMQHSLLLIVGRAEEQQRDSHGPERITYIGFFIICVCDLLYFE